MILLISVFQENYVFIEEEIPSNKVVVVKEGLVDLPGIKFVDEECRNLKAVIDGAELTRIFNRKKKSDLWQACRRPSCERSFWPDWGNHDFVFGYILFAGM